MKDYLLANWVLPVSGPPIPEGFVAFENGRITELGRVADLPSAPLSGCRVQEFRSDTVPSLLTPGLINTHAHLELSFPAPLPLQESMAQWLLDVVALTRKHGTPTEKQARCDTGVREMLATGTTCVNDISGQGDSLSVLDNLGMRAVVALEFFHPAPQPVQAGAILETYAQYFSPYSRHPRIRLGISPHSPYNVSPAAWREVQEACSPFLVHAHAGESRAETDWLAGRPNPLDQLHQKLLGSTFRPTKLGLSPVAYLEAQGLLSDRLIVAHAVCLDDGDRRLLHQHGVGVSHCPRSNRMLHGETLAWSAWEEAGVAIGLGTDSGLSSPDLDLRAEARFAASIHGWPETKALRHCTLEGARALKLSAFIGAIEPEKLADLVLWRTAPKLPVTSPEVAWLDKNTRVEKIWIDGKETSH